MQLAIEQLLGLTIAGNAFLQGHDIGRFWPDSEVFIFCRSVRFVADERSQAGGPLGCVAPDPLAWLEELEGNCQGLRLHVVRRDTPDLADWMTVALAGGGSQWLIETLGGSEPRFWTDDWSSDSVADEDRPWLVTYRGVPVTGVIPGGPADLDTAEHDLAAAIAAIRAFAQRIDSHYAQFFREALAILEGARLDERSFSAKLGLDGFLSPQAKRIIAACDRAWVFGGMGAWNDQDYGKKGERLTEALFARLQAALSAAANSTVAAAPERPSRPSPTAPSDR